MLLRWRFRGDAVQVQAEADNWRGAGERERKTRFVPRSLVLGMMEGPRERERHPAVQCEKR